MLHLELNLSVAVVVAEFVEEGLVFIVNLGPNGVFETDAHTGHDCHHQEEEYIDQHGILRAGRILLRVAAEEDPHR